MIRCMAGNGPNMWPGNCPDMWLRKGLSCDACLTSNAGIRPLTFDLNPKDIKIHEPGGTTHNPFHTILRMMEILRNNYTKLHNYTGPQRKTAKINENASQLTAENSTSTRDHCAHVWAWYDCAWPVWGKGGSMGILNSLTTINYVQLL